jgi:signal transduction histidine kinase
MIGAMQDMTERERLVGELKAALAAKDEFLGMVSHELKTPITTIFGNAEVLRLRGDRIPAGSRQEALADIANDAGRLNRIIDNLLVLARLERGQEIETEPVFITHLAERSLDAHRRASYGRQIEFSSAARDSLVQASPIYVEQVLRNLLSNAEKYSPPGTPIEVEVRRSGGAARIVVRDKGGGFAEGEAEKLFTPFYRSPATADQTSGVGIGLAVCRRLVEAQGGEMWARPRAGGGAEFEFTLPLADDE